MPPNEQALAKALEALQQVELESFTATPSTIGPFAQSELRWRVNAPASVKLELDGRPVARNGSKVVQPTTTRTFSLVARASTLSSLLGQRTVTVNLDACALITVPEADVQATLLGVIEMLMAEDPALSLRSQPVLDVTPSGIVMKLRFLVKVPNSRNPDFNVDALIGLAVDGEGIRPFFLQFSADLDFSFWEDALHIAIDATVGTLAGGPFIHLAIADAESGGTGGRPPRHPRRHSRRHRRVPERRSRGMEPASGVPARRGHRRAHLPSSRNDARRQLPPSRLPPDRRPTRRIRCDADVPDEIEEGPEADGCDSRRVEAIGKARQGLMT